MVNNVNKNIQTEKYIGIPYVVNGRDFNGIDCYGLVRLVYKEELGIDLPSFVEEGINPERTQELIAQYKEGWEPTDTIEAGDVIVFKVMGVDAHIAVAVSSTHFLHARQGYDSAIESFQSGRWKTRLVGAYKYSPNKSELLALPAANSVVLNGIPHPLRTERITTAIPAGTNVVQLEQWILKEYKIDDKLHPYVKVLVNGVPIPDAMKESTIIQENDCVEYRVLAQGGGDILRTVLTVAVIAAVAYATGGTALGGLGWGSSFGIVGTTVTGLALTAVGMALVDAIAPVRPPSASAGGVDPGSANAQLMVTGGANRATPYSSIPFVLGKVRVTPPLGANSYYFFNDQGTESYLRMLLVWGYGPLYVDETTLKVGELPLTNYEGVTKSTLNRITEPDAATLAAFNGLYGTDKTQVTANVEITADGVAGAAVTGPWLTYSSTDVPIVPGDPAVSDFTLAVHFPQGCRRIESKGSNAGGTLTAPVQLEIEYKKASAGTWISAGTSTVGTTAAKDAFTWTKKITYESTELVQVRIRRLTGTGTGPGAPTDENYQWLFTSQLLNITFSRNAQPAVDPVNCKIAKTALEIKASDQLNGQIEGINAIVWSYGKDWNGSAWVDANINNPASLFRYVLEHPANPRRVTDVANKINLTQLQHWHEYCTTKGFTFNSVVGTQRSVLDILRDICAAGRASPAMVDGKWTVIIDEPKANVVQHFSPHNSWGFEGTKALPRIPDGLRVGFINEDKNYQEDEVIVYATASSQSTAALLESISVPGVTTAAKAIDHARWHMAQAKLRPETYTLNTDIEYIVCNRGDRVKVMHDVAMWGLGSGRIKNRLAGNLFELTEDVPITNASYNFRFRSKSGTSTTANLVRVFNCTNAVRTSNVVTITLDGTGHPLSVGDTVTVAISNASYNTSVALVSAVAANTFSYTLAGADIASAAVTGTTTLNDDNYSKVKIDATLADTLVDNDDLYLYGTVSTESQDLVVLSIEPMSNKSARLTLVDYGVTASANIFDDYLNYTNTLAFESNISLPPVMLIQSFGTKVPTITGIISDERVMERIAAGVFAYKMQVSYSNAADLPATTTSVEFQWDFQSAVDYYGTRSKQVAYNLGSVLITGVEEGEALKVRARYVGSDGRTGQWTAWTNHTIIGKLNPPSDVTGFSVATDSATGKLRFTWGSNTEPDIKVYEVRTDTVWGNAANRVFLGDATTCLDTPPASGASRTYYIKAIDYSNNYSVTAASISYTTAALPNISDITYSFYDTSTSSATVTLSWTDVAPTFGLAYYEVTYGSTVRNVASNNELFNADWVGDRTFTVKTVDVNGNKSSGYSEIIAKSLPVPPASAAFLVNQGTLVLDWVDSVKTTLPIWGYEVRVDTTFGNSSYLFKGAASQCNIPRGNIAEGSNTYYIKAIDTDGNYSSTYYTAVYNTGTVTNTASASYIYTDTSLTAATVTVSWEDVVPVFGLSGYEVSYASVTVFSKTNSIVLPANWLGERTFTIKTVDNLGFKSSGYNLIATKVKPNPITNFRSQVIDNTVMFYWDLPTKTSLPIDHVLLKKGSVGSTWETAAVIGPKSGGFTTQNETTAGQYVYYVAAVDTDGNASDPVSITTSVAQPPDFVFFANYQSEFTGTKSSAVKDSNVNTLILPVNTTETFQDHFTTNSWTTPQNQIDAGYPVYIQPSAGTGYYEETFDYGTLLTSSKVTLILNGTVVAGTVTIVPTISVSANGSTWTDYAGVYEVFTTSFRYVKVRVTATANAAGIYSLTYLQVNLDSKLLNDAGTVSCLSTDTLGTIVNFNKEFVDVTSITVSPAGTTAIIPVYDFTDSVASATYSITTNVCTVTSTAHGLITGQKVRLGFSSGTAPSAVYTITGYTSNTFTVSITTANTSGNVTTYPESFRVYLFNTSGARVSATASWSLKGY